MATIGERLTEARKNFGIDIRSAAEATKIRSDFLAALEENAPERIKLADVYKVGFLRIYAKYLKLDADRLVAEFRTSLSFHSASARGGHRSHLGGENTTGGNAAGIDGGSVFSGSKETFSFGKWMNAGGSRLVVAVVAVLVVIVGVAVGISMLGGDDVPVETASTSAVSTPDTQTYEFQLVSKVPQLITITDRFGAARSQRAAVLNNVQISENRPMILKARGVLEIRDTGNRNLEIRFPSRDALKAATDANVPVKFTDADAKSGAFSNEGNWWTADPYSSDR
ncbi:MAG: hypothetical protein E7037_05405 [Verrucomicrobia bacterium]|nr:hypothetical protein [Verrucomicrobiota bacterium]